MGVVGTGPVRPSCELAALHQSPRAAPLVFVRSATPPHLCMRYARLQTMIAAPADLSQCPAPGSSSGPQKKWPRNWGHKSGRNMIRSRWPSAEPAARAVQLRGLRGRNRHRRCGRMHGRWSSAAGRSRRTGGRTGRLRRKPDRSDLGHCRPLSWNTARRLSISGTIYVYQIPAAIELFA